MKILPDHVRDNNCVHVGLIGSGIRESRSPAMHMSEALAQGIQLDYHLIDLEQLGISDRELPQLLDEIESLGYVGLNITHPCKQSVIEYLDELSIEANELGAVNTVIFSANSRTGHNTDWSGFYKSFTRGLPDVATNRVLQLGAGGAGSAVAYSLARTGINELAIFDINTTRSDQLAHRLSSLFGNIKITILEEVDQISDMDGIINTTPVGMKHHPGTPLPVNLLEPGQWVADVIYFPLQTELLKGARTTGCRVLDGSGMAVYQAAEAFRLFTGKTADSSRLMDFLKAQ